MEYARFDARAVSDRGRQEIRQEVVVRVMGFVNMLISSIALFSMSVWSLIPAVRRNVSAYLNMEGLIVVRQYRSLMI